MYRLRIFLGVTALSPLLFPCAGSAQESSAGVQSTIDSIEIVTYNVFREEEAGQSFLFRLANAVRFKTRSGVVRRELLFRNGDPYDSASVAETQRNLRRLGIFRRVSVDSISRGDKLILRVETEDAWSTQLQANARSTDTTFTWTLAISEENFLGRGNLVSVAYRDELDRTAVTFRGTARRAFGTRIAISGKYDNLSDGDVGTWSAGVPFRSNVDRQAVVFSGTAATRRVLQFRDGSISDSLQRRVLRNNLTAAYALRASSRGYLRVGVQAQIRREEYVAFQDAAPAVPDSLLAIPDSLTAALGAFLEWSTPRFLVLTHYNGFSREEDIDLSSRIRVESWAAPSSFGYARSGVGMVIDAQTGFVFGKNFGKIRARVNKLLTSSAPDTGTVFATMTIGSKLISRQATMFHVEAGSRTGTPFGSEFDLGHGVGPRAFGPHAFTGERMIWSILEHRIFVVDEFLGLFGLGIAGFFDYGGAWFKDQSSRFGGDVGIGLRTGTSRSTGNNVGRFDVAYRFGEGFVGNRWVFSFGRAFAF